MWIDFHFRTLGTGTHGANQLISSLFRGERDLRLAAKSPADAQRRRQYLQVRFLRRRWRDRAVLLAGIASTIDRRIRGWRQRRDRRFPLAIVAVGQVQKQLLEGSALAAISRTSRARCL
jgi:hypothetical protein